MRDGNPYKSDLVDLPCKLLHTTPGAWRIQREGKDPVWVQRACAELYDDAGTGVATLTLPRWIAREKRLL